MGGRGVEGGVEGIVERSGRRDQLKGLSGSWDEIRWSSRRMRMTGCMNDWYVVRKKVRICSLVALGLREPAGGD